MAINGLLVIPSVTRSSRTNLEFFIFICCDDLIRRVNNINAIM